MADGASIVPELEEQKNLISNISKKELQKEDVWCLMDNKWFKQWKKYVGYDSWETANVGDRATHPGPIDNSPLLRDDGSGDIKDHLIDELDYILLPEEAWNYLVKWYGLTEGQQTIARKVVEYGMFVKHCKVEVYLLEFKLCSNNDMEHVLTSRFSKANTIEYIEQEMRRFFKIAEDKETRLWNRYSSNTYEHLSNKESTVQDAGLYNGQVIIIEEKNDDGTWPRQVKSTSAALAYTNPTSTVSGESRPYNNQITNTIATRSYSVGSSYNSRLNYDYTSSGSGSVQPGLCGLSNLGNTCFMNSALQCMSNTSPVVDYFLQDKYWDELNKDNPLGMHGEIAKSFGDLVKNMWCGQYTYTVPRNFKMIVGRFAPQFSGYQQQDCQELMAFLLDGLHEDLNRVKKKPYIELKDADGRPDELVAKEAWENYLKRNNSVIVDTFHGLLKSTLVCPECSKVSVTFDPFCYLSLPLPLKKERPLEVVFVDSDPLKRPLRMKVIVPKVGTIHDLCEAVAKVASVRAASLVVADVYNHRLHKIFNNKDSLTNIIERDDIFVYDVSTRLDLGPNHGVGETYVVPVYFKEKCVKTIAGVSCGVTSSQLFGHPFYVPIRSHSTYENLYVTLIHCMRRFIKMPETDEDWEVIDSNECEKQNGEVEMTNGEDYDSNPSDGEKENMENDESGDVKEKSRHLFVMKSVNAAGNLEIDHFKDDGLPLKLDKKTYLVVEWCEKKKQKFLDEKEFLNFNSHESINMRMSQKKQVIKLSECLELFTTIEKLGAEDPWYCPSCKKHQQATKKFDLWSLPKVLIIHLKRFSYNKYWRDKLDTLVDFPVNDLNMSKYVLNPSHGPAAYDLTAVANHYGGMGGGHYTAYGKNKISDQWYYFDDSSVTSSTEENVVSKAAYVLFYIRRDASHNPSRQTISAALGAPRNPNTSSPDDNDEASSSDEDCNMDVN